MLMNKKIKGSFLCIIMTVFFMILVFSGSAYAEETAIYCSPDGTESGNGTESSPVDLLTAISMAKPGAYIYLLDGTYSYDSQITIEADISGTEENKIKLCHCPIKEKS